MDSYTYELFMERGWRRCGTYFYKPNLAKSCCKLFSHRLQVERFRIKKDQKKAVKKVIMMAYDKVDAPSTEAKGRHSEHEIKNRNSKSKIKV